MSEANASERAASVLARLDRLPLSGYGFGLIALLALAGAFELYDITLTATLTPALVKLGVFRANAQAAFAAVTFAGLFVGTAFVAPLGDRFGRRPAFAFSLAWYAFFGVVMALQNSALGIEVARFVAGIGIGVQLVTLDSYVAELAPKAQRGRAFAFSQSLQFVGVPVAAIASALLLAHAPLGIAGWRIVATIPILGLLVAYLIFRYVPESPRWLVRQGRIAEAAAVTGRLEAHLRVEPPPVPATPPPSAVPSPSHGLGVLWSPQYRRRTNMLIVFNVFQAAGFFGFSTWVPTLLAAQGVTFTRSLAYSAVIALVYPLCPLLFAAVADQFERKTQLVVAAIGIAVFGLLFSTQRAPGALIALGVLVTFFGTLLSYAGHAYQSELFPTDVRARAVGFVYSFGRLSPLFASVLIGVLLQRSGTGAVFAFIAGCMVVVIVAVAGFGPNTRNLALEQISPTG